jgi:hypothetical protein
MTYEAYKKFSNYPNKNDEKNNGKNKKNNGNKKLRHILKGNLTKTSI